MEATTRSPQSQEDALYALPDITSRGKFSKSHLYNMMARGHFPKPVLRCGPRFTRWNAAAVDAWMADPASWIAANEAKARAEGGGNE
jgi:predicted DNA-binding transcriptional regulator AlpA